MSTYPTDPDVSFVLEKEISKDRPFQFYGFPLPLDRLDGSPVRVVGII